MGAGIRTAIESGRILADAKNRYQGLLFLKLSIGNRSKNERLRCRDRNEAAPTMTFAKAAVFVVQLRINAMRGNSADCARFNSLMMQMRPNGYVC
jgi:hypothetical protein